MIQLFVIAKTLQHSKDCSAVYRSGWQSFSRNISDTFDRNSVHNKLCIGIDIFDQKCGGQLFLFGLSYLYISQL